ncbi:MAG: hypothetical protein KAS60_02385 [Thermoplasmata archaeon]|nr:hypothetical protein [Thermoplasmata archaeon]
MTDAIENGSISTTKDSEEIERVGLGKWQEIIGRYLGLQADSDEHTLLVSIHGDKKVRLTVPDSVWENCNLARKLKEIGPGSHIEVLRTDIDGKEIVVRSVKASG